VGKAFLRELAKPENARFRLVAATDSRATVVAKEGLDPGAILRCKESGGSVEALPGAQRIDLELAFRLIGADFVVDALPTELARAEEKKQLWLSAARAGASVILAGKDALWAGAEELLRCGSVGFHAALGGTGCALAREIDALRAECARVALVPNVTTTTVIESLESGADWSEALERARARGCLESDPTLDFRGHDAAVKLGIVARAVFGIALPLESLELPDLRAIDVDLLRLRKRKNTTTRLVARCSRAGEASVAFEEVAQPSPFAPSGDRVVYAYESGGRWIVHVGAGAGPRGTGRALVENIQQLLEGGRR
jgi:homoserine dehydrogenase